MEQPLESVGARDLGKAERLEDAAGRYIEFCKSTVPFGLHLSGLRLVVDCAHGATYHVAPAVFEELGAEVITIGASPDGLNINDDVGATAPHTLQKAVLQYRADLGVAFDGDGDRVIMVDHAGEVLDGDELLLIIADARRAVGALNGPVIGTVMSNFGLEEALRERGVELCRAKVGDRYVLEMMRERGSIVGGETSGHIICLDRVTTGDGIVAALQVLHALQERNTTLHQLKQGMSKYPQVLVNVRVPPELDVLSMPAVEASEEAARTELDGSGRILLRPSGTEPVVRVMVEGRDHVMVRDIARRGRRGSRGGGQGGLTGEFSSGSGATRGPVRATGTRCEYIPVRSAAASLRPTVPVARTGPPLAGVSPLPGRAAEEELGSKSTTGPSPAGDACFIRASG